MASFSIGDVADGAMEEGEDAMEEEEEEEASSSPQAPVEWVEGTQY